MPKEKLNAKEQLYNDLQTEEGRARLLNMMQTIDPNFTQKIGTIGDILAKVTEQYVEGAKPYWNTLSEQINKIKSCFNPLSEQVNKIKSWLHSDDGKEFIKNMRLFLYELEKAKQRADDVEKILNHGSIGELITVEPINGLTLMFITGSRVEEIKEIEKGANEFLEKQKNINKKKGRGGITKGVNGQKTRDEIIMWYKEGKEQGSWNNHTEALETLKKWQESCKTLEQYDYEQAQKLKAPKKITHSNTVVIEVAEEPPSIIAARTLVKKMSDMNAVPSEIWSKNAIDQALNGIK